MHQFLSCCYSPIGNTLAVVAVGGAGSCSIFAYFAAVFCSTASTPDIVVDCKFVTCSVGKTFFCRFPASPPLCQAPTFTKRGARFGASNVVLF